MIDDDYTMVIWCYVRSRECGFYRSFETAHDILAYFDAVKVAKKYVDENPDTILVSTADHETGGLCLGRNSSNTWHVNLVNEKLSSLLILFLKRLKII